MLENQYRNILKDTQYQLDTALSVDSIKFRIRCKQDRNMIQIYQGELDQIGSIGFLRKYCQDFGQFVLLLTNIKQYNHFNLKIDGGSLIIQQKSPIKKQKIIDEIKIQFKLIKSQKKQACDLALEKIFYKCDSKEQINQNQTKQILYNVATILQQLIRNKRTLENYIAEQKQQKKQLQQKYEQIIQQKYRRNQKQLQQIYQLKIQQKEFKNMISVNLKQYQKQISQLKDQISQINNVKSEKKQKLQREFKGLGDNQDNYQIDQQEIMILVRQQFQSIQKIQQKSIEQLKTQTLTLIKQTQNSLIQNLRNQNILFKMAEFYKNNILKDKDNSIILPIPFWRQDNEVCYEDFSKFVIGNIYTDIGNDINKYISMGDNKPQMKIYGKQKLKYFNMRKYYQCKDKSFYFKIQKNNLKKCIKNGNIRNQFYAKINEKQSQEKGLQYAYNKLNNFLGVFFGINFESLSNFSQIFKEKNYKNMKSLCFISIQFLETKNTKTQIPKYETLFDEKQLNQIQKCINYTQIEKNINSYRWVMNQTAFVKNIIVKNINWGQIKELIESQQRKNQVIKQVNEEFMPILNSILKKIGVSAVCLNLYNFFYNNGEILISQQNLPNPCKNILQFDGILKSLYKFDLREDTQRCNSKQDIPQNYFIIGLVQKQIFQVSENYKNVNELTVYLEKDNDKIYESLKTLNMRNFLYSELASQQDNSFLKLFKNIDISLEQLNLDLTYEMITDIYKKVSGEINQFNKQLSQVSRNIAPTFSGYIHIYALYMYWKRISESREHLKNK